MTDDPQSETDETREAETAGEKPDLGHRPDALAEALSGSNVGSDTRAGSLRGGSASGSDDDPDQQAIDAMLASEGKASADAPQRDEGGANGDSSVNNVGRRAKDDGAKDADAASG